MLRHRSHLFVMTLVVAAAGIIDTPVVFGQGCPIWEDRTPSEIPGERRNHAMAYDIARGVIVMFGGEWTLDENPGDTWEFDGVSWSLRSGPGPTPRNRHVMAYDIQRGVTVLYGGSGGGEGASTETWEWDGATWSLRETVGPGGGSDFAMAYDSARGVSVLFTRSGGGQTWEWNGSAWAMRSESGPGVRSSHAMAYDSARGVTVLYGGYSYDAEIGYIYHADTWEWDGTVWIERLVVGPGQRASHQMAYDEARGVTVLFNATDTWEWDGTQWSVRAVPAPPSRGSHAMAYDSARNVITLFGGGGGCSDFGFTYGDTWEWDGVEWMHGLATPSQRSGTASVFHAATEKTILFGGTYFGCQVFSETWAWDGASWSRLSIAGPPGRIGHVLSYDGAREVSVLFGGAVFEPTWSFFGDTWEWDGLVWNAVAEDGPPARTLHAMAFDSVRGVTVLYGGSSYDPENGWTDYDDTWEWDGDVWTNVATGGPSMLYGQTMAFDAARGVTVIYGGWDSSGTFYDETWEWDGTSWSVWPGIGSSNEDVGKMVFDSTRSTLILVKDGWPALAVYEREDTSWTRRVVLSDAPLTPDSLAFDSVRERLVVFSEMPWPHWSSGETWEYHCDSTCNSIPSPIESEQHPLCDPPCIPEKNRYLSFVAPQVPAAAASVALRVTFGPAPESPNCAELPGYVSRVGVEMWVGPEVLMPGNVPTGIYALQTTPYYRDWTTIPGGVVHVADCNIVPCATYTVDAISEVRCSPPFEDVFSEPLELKTNPLWGDIVGAFDTTVDTYSTADGIVDFTDIAAAVECFKDTTRAPPRTWCDLHARNPNQGASLNIDFFDIQEIVAAFRGGTYPFAGPSAPDACEP